MARSIRPIRKAVIHAPSSDSPMPTPRMSGNREA